MDPLSALHHRITELLRENGEPTTQDVARRTGYAVSHTTVAKVLRGDRLPRWEQLELIVEALYGDLREFRTLWIVARGWAESDPAGERAAINLEHQHELHTLAQSDYFCYVSTAKVERLFADMSTHSGPKEVVEAGKAVKTEDVEELFRSGASFGRPHILTRGSSKRVIVMRQLREVLGWLADSGAIGILRDHDPIPTTTYLAYTGNFRRADTQSLDDPSAAVVRLTSIISERYVLLDCSLRYFSEAVEGQYVITSDNSWLLNGGGSLVFDTVFVTLEQHPSRIIGSPIFLKLRSGGMDITV